MTIPGYDPSARTKPDDPCGVNLIWSDILDLMTFGRNLSRRLRQRPPRDPRALFAEVDATLRASGICEADMDLARGIVCRAMARERGFDLP